MTVITMFLCFRYLVSSVGSNHLGSNVISVYDGEYVKQVDVISQSDNKTFLVDTNESMKFCTLEDLPFPIVIRTNRISSSLVCPALLKFSKIVSPVRIFVSNGIGSKTVQIGDTDQNSISQIINSSIIELNRQQRNYAWSRKAFGAVGIWIFIFLLMIIVYVIWIVMTPSYTIDKKRPPIQSDGYYYYPIEGDTESSDDKLKTATCGILIAFLVTITELVILSGGVMYASCLSLEEAGFIKSQENVIDYFYGYEDDIYLIKNGLAFKRDLFRLAYGRDQYGYDLYRSYDWNISLNNDVPTGKLVLTFDDSSATVLIGRKWDLLNFTRCSNSASLTKSKGVYFCKGLTCRKGQRLSVNKRSFSDRIPNKALCEPNTDTLSAGPVNRLVPFLCMQNKSSFGYVGCGEDFEWNGEYVKNGYSRTFETEDSFLITLSSIRLRGVVSCEGGSSNAESVYNEDNGVDLIDKTYERSWTKDFGHGSCAFHYKTTRRVDIEVNSIISGMNTVSHTDMSQGLHIVNPDGSYSEFPDHVAWMNDDMSHYPYGIFISSEIFIPLSVGELFTQNSALIISKRTDPDMYDLTERYRNGDRSTDVRLQLGKLIGGKIGYLANVINTEQDYYPPLQPISSITSENACSVGLVIDDGCASVNEGSPEGRYAYVNNTIYINASKNFHLLGTSYMANQVVTAPIDNLVGVQFLNDCTFIKGEQNCPNSRCKLYDLAGSETIIIRPDSPTPSNNWWERVKEWFKNFWWIFVVIGISIIIIVVITVLIKRSKGRKTSKID